MPHFAFPALAARCPHVVSLGREGTSELRGGEVRAVWQEVAEGVELCMQGRVTPLVCPVSPARDDLAVVHEDAADRNLPRCERFFALRDGERE